MIRALVPEGFDIPVGLVTEEFKLSPLCRKYSGIDYAAVTGSMAYRGGIDEEVKKLTREQNLENIKRHEKEFKRREAFAYTVLSPDKKKCLGCVYINRPTRGNFDAEVWMWVTVESLRKGLDEKLYESVWNWIDEKWPFKHVAYPGRSIAWEEWDQL